MQTQTNAKSHGALVQLRAWLAQNDPEQENRLPPERILCEKLGVTRGDLRKALSVLEKEGAIWRHVGKGTFVGTKPLDDMLSLPSIQHRTSPNEVMRTRILIEPLLAREAALHATQEDVAAMTMHMNLGRDADTWRQYEVQDNALHRVIALASANKLLLAIFDGLNAVRRAVVWGRLRQIPDRPPADHHSFAEHEAIVTAISERDLDGAEIAMQKHLRTVAQRLLEK
ncbi:FadR/GntR family transcriptional regulator [Alkalilacustris brevis]|uniref:FadR/GntR family transcriptional regulator n=1 Tax=Alkalilacustris brevis TaxID=2026338 RepID=UPI000E0DA08D|nr:FCD domain-containing protein [Alkalilacustris brevis]